MAAIASINAGIGAFAVAETALSADDTITFDATRQQHMSLRNTTGAPVVVTLDGTGGTTVAVQGIGSVSVASGLAITVPANSRVDVILSTVSKYCQGVVHLTGGVGVSVAIVNL